MLKSKEIDIFDSGSDAIIHCCNCFHTMGAGIALEIKRRYPAAYEADLSTEYASRHKLGLFSIGRVSDGNIKYVVNLYAQYGFGRERAHFDYGAFEAGIRRVISWAEGENPKMTIGIPFKIGCGLAGGSWASVKDILEKNFSNTTVTGLVCIKP